MRFVARLPWKVRAGSARSRERVWRSAALPVSAAIAVVAVAVVAPGPAVGAPGHWEESFAQPLDWGSPSHHDAATIRRIYTLASDESGPFLRAQHDAARRPGYSPPPAVHYGHAFADGAAPLAANCILEWKWRVLEHPAQAKDAWEDVAASLYVVLRPPGLFTGGRGFKFGWLSRPSPAGTKQRGLYQIELRHDPAGPGWQTERVDLCVLAKQLYDASPEKEQLRYIGVVTDADGTHSSARADYAHFRLGPLPGQ
jgi:hypothetical protein